MPYWLLLIICVAHPTYFNSKHVMHAHTNLRMHVSTHPVAKISCDARNNFMHIKHGGTYNHIGILFIPQFAIFGQWQALAAHGGKVTTLLGVNVTIQYCATLSLN